MDSLHLSVWGGITQYYGTMGWKSIFHFLLTGLRTGWRMPAELCVTDQLSSHNLARQTITAAPQGRDTLLSSLLLSFSYQVLLLPKYFLCLP